MESALVFIALAAVLGLFMTWGVGANDVANAMGTSVGSGAITVKKAILIAAIFEFTGAFLFQGATDESPRVNERGRRCRPPLNDPYGTRRSLARSAFFERGVTRVNNHRRDASDDDIGKRTEAGEHHESAYPFPQSGRPRKMRPGCLSAAGPSLQGAAQLCLGLRP